LNILEHQSTLQTDRQTDRNQVQKVNLENQEQKPCMLLQLLLLSHHRRKENLREERVCKLD
jgi:hypothetical protein